MSWKKDRAEKEMQEGTDSIMKKAQAKAKEDSEKNKEICTLKSLTICGDDLETLKKIPFSLDESGIINHIITMIEEHQNK